MKRLLWAAALGAAMVQAAPVGAQPSDIAVRAAEADGFNGAALVGIGGRIAAIEAIGTADAEHGVPIAANTRFEAGSASQWIAAILVLKLVDQHRLGLDTPIDRYLPGYRAENGRKLTLRMLMSHVSGVPDDVSMARRADPSIASADLPQMAAVRRYASGDLAFVPGTRWDYSHSNWLLVKAVIEQRTRRPYAKLVDRLLVRPLGLRDSGIFRGDSAAVDGTARGYARLGSRPERQAVRVPDFMAAAGGYYTTAPDMLRLMEAVLGGNYLSPKSRQDLLRVLVPQQHYALGGRVRTETIAGKQRRTAWIDGSSGGFRMVARRVLADGHSVVLFANASYDPAKLEALASQLLDQSYAGEGR